MADTDTDSVPSGDAATPVNETGSPPVHEPAKPWLEKIAYAEKCFETWQKKCDSVDKLYGDLEKLAGDTPRDREFQIFWANLEVIKPSIYARAPVPVCVPAFKDRNPVARKAAEMVERSEITSFRTEDLDSVLKLVRDDLATLSRGVLRCRYKATPVDPKQPALGIKDERVCYDFFNRKDFLHDPARYWREVEWVAFGSWLTKKQGLDRFRELWLQAEFKQRGELPKEGYSGNEKGRVWEIWHKPTGMVIWVTPNVEQTLDMKPAWLNLEGFFPAPRPAFGTLQRNSLIPLPDFLYIKDQVEEVNELTARIGALSEALIVRGVYPGGAGELGDVIESAFKSTDKNAVFQPLANFNQLGGQALKDAIVYWPTDMVATVIKELILLRREIIDDIYQITGLSDIMRGATDPNETLGAQELKSQYGSIRVRQKQEEMIRVARDVARISGEIMAENFSPETLVAMSQMNELPTQAAIDQQVQQIIAQAQAQAEQFLSSPEAQQMPPEQAQQMIMQGAQQVETQIGELQQEVTLEQVIGLLQAERLRPFVLDIETDSTIQPDEDAAKQRVNEFLTAIGGFMQQALPVVQGIPQAAPLFGAFLKLAASQYRAGRETMDQIEQFADQIEEQAKQPPQPNPEQQAAEQQMQMDQERHQQDMEAKQADADAKAQESAARMEEIAAKTEAQREAQDFAREKHVMDMQMADMQRTSMEQKSNAELTRMAVQDEAAQRDARRKDAEHNRKMVDEADADAESEGTEKFSETITSALEGMEEKIDELIEKMSAPVSLEYGRDGKVSAVVKGGDRRPVKRENGLVTGLN